MTTPRPTDPSGFSEMKPTPEPQQSLLPRQAASDTRSAFCLLLTRSPILPAPMCGISDRAWRILAREQGCHLVFTQMVSSEALIHDHRKTWDLLDLKGEEGPVAVQLFGCKPEDLAQTARMLEEAGADVVDFNMGCPARKIVKTQGGSSLLREPVRVREILRAMRRALQGPFTVKIRAGWNRLGDEAFTIARIAEDEGVDAITLHARTREQGFKGQADWSIIAALKQRVRIPVIGNGDVRTAADAQRMIRETGCDGVMIGRGIIGNFWLLGRAVACLRGEPEPPEPTLRERLALMRRHAGLMAGRRGTPRGLIEFRKHAVQYLRGIRGSHAVKLSLMQVRTLDELEQALANALERDGEEGFDLPDPTPGAGKTADAELDEMDAASDSETQ
jgi:nifR3 family TIM-barrel protein